MKRIIDIDRIVRWEWDEETLCMEVGDEVSQKSFELAFTPEALEELRKILEPEQ